MAHLTRQVEIIHLSDFHFGKGHRFDPMPTPDKDIPSREGRPKLIDKLLEDLEQPTLEYPIVGVDDIEMSFREAPTLVCITGDFATRGDYSEFEQAEEFIERLKMSLRLALQERA